MWGNLPVQDDFLESMAEAAKAIADLVFCISALRITCRWIVVVMHIRLLLRREISVFGLHLLRGPGSGMCRLGVCVRRSR